MTSIDFTTEESVNYILNYSEMLINEMSKKKTRNTTTEQSIRNKVYEYVRK